SHASGRTRCAPPDGVARRFTMGGAQPLAWPVFVEERQALDDLDIPHFTVATGETAVRAGARIVGARFFSRPGLDTARDRIRSLSEPDLQVQLEWIARS